MGLEAWRVEGALKGSLRRGFVQVVIGGVGHKADAVWPIPRLSAVCSARLTRSAQGMGWPDCTCLGQPASPPCRPVPLSRVLTARRREI